MGIKDSAMFLRFTRKAFDEIDLDKTGRADYKEVCIGILKIYDALNSKMPAHVKAPKRSEMLDLCRKYDHDGNGFIEFDEFFEMSKVLVGSRKNWRDSLPWKYGSVLVLKILVCPLAAAALVKGLCALDVPHASRMPVAPLAAVLEVGIKLASKAV